MYKVETFLNRKFVLFILTLFSIISLVTTMIVFNEALADSENDFDTVTVKGKVLNTSGDAIASAQIQYNDGKEVHSLHPADMSGGMYFVIPATSDCTLIFYQDGYKPLAKSYTAETLQKSKPVLDVGNIILENGDYIKISGVVYDLFYSTPVCDVDIVYFLSVSNEACKARTDENGKFTLTVPKNYDGFWQFKKDGYDLYKSDVVSYSQDTKDANFSIRQSNKFRVIFESNGGNTISSQILDAGKCVVKPQDPFLENFIFDGWYIDNNSFKKAYDFSQPVDADLTLYAKWNGPVKVDCVTSAQTGDNLYGLEIALICIALLSFLCAALIKFTDINV